jgi:hypothetical protein
MTVIKFPGGLKPLTHTAIITEAMRTHRRARWTIEAVQAACPTLTDDQVYHGLYYLWLMGAVAWGESWVRLSPATDTRQFTVERRAPIGAYRPNVRRASR